ncbi:acyl-CoA-binding domain-containing protein 6 isoform X3 [Phoca vitulina]|uniref:acyl-CoA-binding domain-containing protein 6 isoform X3 n=1 Tax=Phoca vitulina TaxID=9720 RepID=UPI0013962DEB|nr:acyl-CoA-binding domain-containing protein 6 isoform X3 [Phoca vitulina]
MASPFLPAGATTGDSGGELSSGDDSGDVESLQSPETEASGSLTELFEKAAAHLQGLVQVASREQLLYLYARYKQVKVGNCNTPKPSFFDFEGKQKWEAWKALGDSSPNQAMQEYIAVVKKLDPGWNPQSPEKKGKEANTGFGGPVVSSLYHEEIIREEDKNIFDYCRENNIDHVTKVIKSKNVDVNMKDEESQWIDTVWGRTNGRLNQTPQIHLKLLLRCSMCHIYSHSFGQNKSRGQTPKSGW